MKLAQIVTKVPFQAPEVGLITPPLEKSAHNSDPSYFELTAIISKAKEDGFEVGAIVTCRTRNQWGGTNPLHWGLISSVKHYRGVGIYYPLTVNWMEDSCPPTHHWPEDLWLIREMENPQDIYERIKQQGEVNASS